MRSTAVWLVIACVALVAFQQYYARTHKPPIEQPVGYLGLAEYFFRHPERLFPTAQPD